MQESFNLVLYPTLMLLFLFLLRYTGESALIIIHWEEYKRIQAPSLLYNFLVDLVCIALLLVYIYFNLARPPVPPGGTCFPPLLKARSSGPLPGPNLGYFLAPSCLLHQPSPGPVENTERSNRQYHLKATPANLSVAPAGPGLLMPTTTSSLIESSERVLIAVPGSAATDNHRKLDPKQGPKSNTTGMDDVANELVKKAKKKEEETNWRQSLIYPPVIEEEKVKRGPVVVAVEKKVKGKTEDCIASSEAGTDETATETSQGDNEPAFVVTYEIARPRSSRSRTPARDEEQDKDENGEKGKENEVVNADEDDGVKLLQNEEPSPPEENSLGFKSTAV